LTLKKGGKFQLTIAGRPSHTSFESYKSLIKELNLSKHVQTYLRYIKNDEIANFYRQADLVVMPYKMISQSGVLLLSMSYRKPVLVSNLPSFTDIIIHRENGFVFQSNNTNDLSR